MEGISNCICVLWSGRIVIGYGRTLGSQAFLGIREAVLGKLPSGFDWTDMEYLKSYSKPILVVTCAYYSVFNVFVGPITEELYFRGYLTSHYEKQGRMTPILIAVLFSLLM